MQFLLLVIVIIMELYLPFTMEVNITFQDLFIIVNIYISKESYTITTKCFKKDQKKSYKEYKYNIMRVVYLKLKNLAKKKLQ